MLEKYQIRAIEKKLMNYCVKSEMLENLSLIEKGRKHKLVARIL